MRNKLVVGNWKMNLTRAQATAAIESLVLLVDPKTEVEVAICPPYLTIECVANLLKSSHFRVGAQDVFWMSAGAFTGSVSASMLADAGCSLCIVGHSETRGRFGKLEVPPSTLPYFAALAGVEGAEFYNGVVAYEPVWAIGTGKTCDNAEANRVCGFIRSQLRTILDEDAAESIRILYGGSVKPANARELFGQPEIDGGLVGGASLDPDDFSEIVRSA